MERTADIHIRGLQPLISPVELRRALPMKERANETVVRQRSAVRAMLEGEDPRLLTVVGPCSIHDRAAALAYAKQLKALADRVADRLLIVMRVYFEKPRTTVGWKGLINDPHLDDSFDLERGLKLAREILLDINELGLACATEILEPFTPQYIADLITLGGIGARTTESQTHRQLASGLSMPVGFKNGTDGTLQSALDAMIAARSPHAFLGVDDDGQLAIVQTEGNPYGHLILRGGRNGTNYASEAIEQAASRLRDCGLPPRIVVDCSHANSGKDHRRQAIAWRDVLSQRAAGTEHITGMMLESNLRPGKQKLTAPDALEYGVSITDACVGWEETERLIMEAYEALPQMARA